MAVRRTAARPVSRQGPREGRGGPRRPPTRASAAAPAAPAAGAPEGGTARTAGSARSAQQVRQRPGIPLAWLHPQASANGPRAASGPNSRGQRGYFFASQRQRGEQKRSITNPTTATAKPALVSTPTLEERRALVRAHQEQAVARVKEDALGANSGVLTGDLMDIAHGMGPQLQDQLAQGAFAGENARAFARSLESHLKVVR